MTPEQLATLKANIQSNPTFWLNGTQMLGNEEIAAYYNTNASPLFTLWKSDVKAEDIGNAWNGTDIDGMSSLNMQRLQLLLSSAPSGILDMTRADRRAGFENPFGPNVNNASRVAMRAAWKRFATVAEKLFATGTGSDASPATTTFEGTVTPIDIVNAIYA